MRRRPVVRYGYYPTHTVYVQGRGYGLSNLVGDVVLTVCTSGLWAIWWIIREVSR